MIKMNTLLALATATVFFGAISTQLSETAGKGAQRRSTSSRRLLRFQTRYKRDGGAAMASSEGYNSPLHPSIPVGPSHSWAAPNRPQALAELVAEEMQSLEEVAGLDGGDNEPRLANILGITAPPALSQVVRPAVEALMNLGNGAGYKMADAMYQTIRTNVPGVICIAETAEDLKKQVEDPDSCFVVLLPPGTFYKIEEAVVVSTIKVVMGYPVDRPIINAEESHRAFNIRRGGDLHIHHVIFYTGETRVGPYAIFRRGGAILAEVGSRLTAVHCFFTIQPEREQLIREKMEFQLGGDIFISGGVASFIRCDMIATVVGFLNGWGTEIGGSVFIAAGAASFTLTNFMTTQLFSYVVGGGIHVVVAGGIGLFVGK